MKISELIAKLEQIKIENGDIPVSIRVDGFGGHALHSTESLNVIGVYPSELEEDFDSDLAKEYFPESEGDYDKLIELDDEIETVVISCGGTLYVT
jgi:hypothetical protein